MQMHKAANRLLDMADLRKPFFRRTVRQMDALLTRHAGFYFHPSKRWEYPWAMERADLAEGACVLDAGCGASIFPLFLGKRRLQVTALDPHLPERLQVPPNVPLAYVRARMQGLPFQNQTFDAVFCISVIEHLPSAEMIIALEEMARVLKPGGRLLVTTDYAQNARERIWYEGAGDRFPVDWNIFDRSRLESLLDAITTLQVEGELDLHADWSRVKQQMRRFHGYPYTSVGIAFRKAKPRRAWT